MASNIGEHIKMKRWKETVTDEADDERFADAKRSGVDITCEVRHIGCIGEQVHHLTSAAIERQLNFVRSRSGNVG